MHVSRDRCARRGQAACGLLVGLSLVLGCGGRPKSADPEVARQTLQTVLEAWKGGQSRDDFAKQSSIHTADSRWAGGCKLLGYTIAATEVHGYDLNFQVSLDLEDGQGNKIQEKALYRVATSPRLVVIRGEDM